MLIRMNENAEAVVSGRELYAALGVDVPYTQWFENMVDYGFLEGTDFYSILSKTSEGGRPSVDHQLTIDMAKGIATLQRTEKGRQVRQYLIGYVKKIPQDLNLLFEDVASMELEEKTLKERVQKVEAMMIETQKGLQKLRESISLGPCGWRTESIYTIKKIAETLGSVAYMTEIKEESYDLLEERAKVRLDIRQTNMRRKVLDETESREEANAISILDVIAADSKLVEIYVAIIKEMAIKYGVA